MEFYGCLTKVDKNGKPYSVGYKYPNGSHKERFLDKKDFRWIKEPKPEAGLYGRDLFAAGSHKYVIVTEGEEDAHSCYQVLRIPSVSVQSSSVAHRDCTADRSWLNSFERVYLAFDNDAPGKEACASVAKLFDYDKVYHVKWDTRKDANEFLQHNEVDELRNIFNNSKKYKPDNIISSFDEYYKLLSEPPKQGVPYPFPTLTMMTYGIRTGESVLITAQEGVGKTELMHAIEYTILKETDSNVGAIFLEESPKRHVEALAGIHLGKPVHLPDCPSSAAEKDAAFREIVQTDDRLHLLVHHGSLDPDNLLDTIRFLVAGRGCRYVLFDHISMAISGLEGSLDERRTIDYLSAKLERLIQELDFALIMVSHVNDDGKTRGSRYVSKLAHTRIDITRDLLSEDPVARNTTHLFVSKGRFGMKTGPAGDLLFDTAKYRFTEVERAI